MSYTKSQLQDLERRAGISDQLLSLLGSSSPSSTYGAVGPSAVQARMGLGPAYGEGAGLDVSSSQSKKEPWLGMFRVNRSEVSPEVVQEYVDIPGRGRLRVVPDPERAPVLHEEEADETFRGLPLGAVLLQFLFVNMVVMSLAAGLFLVLQPSRTNAGLVFPLAFLTACGMEGVLILQLRLQTEI